MWLFSISLTALGKLTNQVPETSRTQMRQCAQATVQAALLMT